MFSEEAVSELDLISRYSDRPAKRAADTGEDHRPLNLIVRQENYSWSFSRYQHSNFFHYIIVNDGPPLRNVWVGFYHGGLVRYAGDRFTTPAGADETAVDYVSDMHLDRSGRLWIATVGSGLLRVDDPAAERPVLYSSPCGNVLTHGRICPGR